MKMTTLTIFCFSVILAANAHEIIPPITIASVEQGDIYNPSGFAPGTITLEAFLDLNCGDSDAAWVELKKVYNYYAGKVTIVVHQLPLPYHRHAYMCTKGYYLILNEDPTSLWSYMETVFTNRASFSSSATRNQTYNQLLDVLATYAEASTNIAKDYFIANLDNYAGLTTQAFKYDLKRGAAGTPWYVVNGVNLEISPSITVVFEDWVVFIDSLLEGTRLSVTEWLQRHLYKEQL